MPERPRIRPGQLRPGWVAGEPWDGPPESWRPIPAYPLLGVPAGYEASSEGRARSPRTVLAMQDDKDGYPTVKLGRKRFRVAVLVQLAWAGPPQVLHLDDDRENSRPSNLRWGSRVENEQMKGKKGKKNRDGSGCHPPFPAVTPVTSEQPRWV